MSHSLDASSPEGRQTWMELGRLLRDEGITPAMIQENRGLLVNAMKATLKDETFLAESVPQSYATAPEYNVDNTITSSVTQSRNASYLGRPSLLSPMSLLGSAPPRSAGFTDAFLQQQNGAASSLDQKQNVDNGIQSLLLGMSDEEFSGEDEQDYVELEHLELEHLQLEDVPIHHNRPRGQGVQNIVKPLAPSLKPGGSPVKFEEKKFGINFEGPHREAREPVDLKNGCYVIDTEGVLHWPILWQSSRKELASDRAIQVEDVFFVGTPATDCQGPRLFGRTSS